MIVDLTEAQAEAVAMFLAGHPGGLSAEIAATDNPAYRRDLMEQREVLCKAQAVLTRATSRTPVEPGSGVPA